MAHLLLLQRHSDEVEVLIQLLKLLEVLPLHLHPGSEEGRAAGLLLKDDLQPVGTTSLHQRSTAAQSLELL